MNNVPRDIVKLIISFYPASQWFGLCKEFNELALQVISPSNCLTNWQFSAVEWVVFNGNAAAVSFLLERYPAHCEFVCSSFGFLNAALNGYKDVVELLLKDHRVKLPNEACFNEALRSTRQYGHTEIAELLVRSRGRPCWL
jgi:hypothetical protein